MVSDNSPDGTVKATNPSLQKGKPENPVKKKKTVSEKKNSDPSSAVCGSQPYPVPSFFEYRAKPKDHDSL